MLSKRRGKIHTVQPGAIVDNKWLSAVLELVKAQPAAYPARQQRGHAARQRPPNNLGAPGLPSKGRVPRHAAAAAPAKAPPWRADPLCIPLIAEIPPAKPAPSRRGWGGFFRDREIYPEACEDGGSATAE